MNMPALGKCILANNDNLDNLIGLNPSLCQFGGPHMKHEYAGIRQMQTNVVIVQIMLFFAPEQFQLGPTILVAATIDRMHHML